MRFFLQLLEFPGGGFFLPPFFMLMEEKEKKIDLAEKLFRQKKYREAISLCKEIHKAYPGEESALLLLSWAYYDSGDTVKAEKCLLKLLKGELKRKAFTGFAFDELVRIYKEQKNYAGLVEICQRAVAAQPDDTGLLMELGSAYLQSGEAGRACGIYEKLIRIESDNSVFYCRWGEALFAAGLYRESEEAYLKAGEIDGGRPDDYCFKIAVLFQQAGNHREAVRLLKKCIAVNSGNPLYHCALGDSLIVLDQVEEALMSYQMAAQKDSRSAGAYYNRLGNALMKAKLFSRAADAFKTAIAHENARPYFLNLASAFREMGLENEAGKILDEVNKIK
jgi:tetratricopeptide (TPR) repeat protein